MKKGVAINLDRPRTLRYGMNALVKIEDLTGKSLLAFDLNNVGVKDLLVIIYCGLCHEDKNLTPEQVGDLIDEYSSISEIAEKLGEALTAAFGADAIEKGANLGEK